MEKGSAGKIAILIIVALIAIGIGVAAKNIVPGKVKLNAENPGVSEIEATE